LLREKLKEILNGTSAWDLAEPLESFLKSLIEELKPLKIIISGSLAKRRFVRGLSDIDILVVVDQDVPRDKRFMLTSLDGVDVEVTVVSKQELEKALEEGRGFYVEAVKHGAVILSLNTSSR